MSRLPLLGLLPVLLLSGCALNRSLPEEVFFLTDARIRFGDEQQWVSVEGPVRLAAADYERGLRATIRYELPGASALGDEQGLYLWRYSMNIRVRVNGTMVYDGGRLEPPLRKLHHPVLIALLPALLSDDCNIVEVDLGYVPGYGYLLPPALGPMALLAPMQERRYFLQLTLSQVTFALSLLLMVLAAVLLLSDRSNRAYLYFGLAALGWSIYSLNPVLPDPPFEQRGWLVVLHLSVDLIAVSLLLFVLGYFKLLKRWHEWAAVGYLLVAALIYRVLPLVKFAANSSLVHLVALALVLFAAVLTLVMAVRHGRRDGYAFTIAFAVLLSLGLHDLLLNLGELEILWLRSFFSLSLGAPLFLSALAVQLLWQLRRSNRYAEEQLAQARAALELSFAERRALEQRNAAAAERARIYRDLHDDVGARLLDLVYAAESEEQKTLARSALDEVRALSSLERNLPDTIAGLSLQLESEVRQRLGADQIALQWQGSESSRWLPPAVAHQAVRVVREWTSNTLKHAGCQTVRASIQDAGQTLQVRFADDGQGLGELAPGNGLTNVARRVASLEGTLAHRGPPGTAWQMALPLAAPAP
ncbi:MAG: 7TM diverse intracellular signaling domain-containing protein [Pseudomonadota bacterium]